MINKFEDRFNSYEKEIQKNKEFSTLEKKKYIFLLSKIENIIDDFQINSNDIPKNLLKLLSNADIVFQKLINNENIHRY